MNHGIHFISGLPRSGSTLLAALLLQNPDLHAGISSPMGSLFGTMLREISQGNETAVLIDDDQRQALLRGLFENYYHAIHPHQTVFDTHRIWCGRLHIITTLFPAARVICCVRDFPWIIDSLERLVRRNRWELSKIFDFEPAGTMTTRADGLISGRGMVGFAANAVKQAMHSEEAGSMMILTYETLTREPEFAMRAVYDFVGLPPFTHDFDDVRFDAEEFDLRLGTPGLHTVQGRVRPTERETILSPDLWRRFERENFWRDPAFNTRGVKII